jgi:hypothetical protein
LLPSRKKTVEIIVSYDQSTGSLPAGFVSAVNYVVNYYDSLFVANVTMNVDIGYGEIDGQPLQSDALSDSYVSNYVTENYGAVRAALMAENAPGASSLPATSPFSGALSMSPVEAAALGLGSASQANYYVGVSSTPGTFSFTPGVTPPSDEYYFVGSLEHEISEDMGRVSLLNYQPSEYALIDMFRYSSSGVRDMTTGGNGSTAYFSINHGATNLGTWNNQVSNGDLADWYPSGPAPGGNDAYNDYSNPGVINVVSANDITLMEALGWQTPTPTWNKIDDGTPTAMVGGDFEGLGSAQLALSEAGAGTYLYLPSSGDWTKISTAVYSQMMDGDFYGTSNGNNNNVDLAAASSGNGIYIWSDSAGWSQIDDGAVSALTSGDFTSHSVAELAVSERGAGTYLWTSGAGFTKIDNGVYSLMAAGNFYGTALGNNNQADVAAYDPGVGAYIWANGIGWTKVDSGSASAFASGNFLGTSDGNNNQTDLAVYFPGSGTYIWSVNAGWMHIDGGAANGLAAVDLTGKGQSELLAYFPGAGMYEYQFGVGWSKYDNTSALPQTNQTPIFAEGNFQGGSDVVGSVGFANTSGVWLDPPGGNSTNSQLGETSATVATDHGNDSFLFNFDNVQKTGGAHPFETAFAHPDSAETLSPPTNMHDIPEGALLPATSHDPFTFHHESALAHFHSFIAHL